MSNSTHEHKNTIFYEMMAHPVLFTHPHPNKVIIIEDEDNSILQEVAKHQHIGEIILVNKSGLSTTSNPKIKHYSSSSTDWVKTIALHSIDIIIHAASPTPALLQNIFTLLHNDGILIQEGPSPFDIAAVKSIADQLRQASFKNQQILHFPQPGFAAGWRSIIMASKQGAFKRVREKTIYAKPFKTYYYNLDTHKASLVIPEFMREEWVI